MATIVARAMGWVLCVALLSAVVPAAGQPKQPPVGFLGAAADGSLTYPVGAVVDLHLPFTVSEARKLEFYLSPLSGEHGDSAVLQQSIVEAADAKASGGRVAFTARPGVMTLRLQGPGLAGAGKYTGTLAVLEDGKPAQSVRIALTRAAAPRPAKVVIEPKSVAVYQRMLPRSAGAFTLQVRNTGAEWPAEGVFMRLVEVTAPAGANFDPVRNLKLTWNGQPADDLWRSPAPGSAARAIAPNQQAEIGGRLNALPAGEYAVKLGIGVANAPADLEQQVAMKLYVKHRWVYPLAVLLLAIALSYMATKGMEVQRRRAAQLERVAELRPAWLREEPATLPAVAARAILTQVEDRYRRWGDAFFGQDVNKARTDKAELLIRILERVRRIQSRAKSAAWNLMVANRFNKRLAAVIAALDPHTVTADRAKQMEAELGALEQWFDTAKKAEAYWSALKGDMATLVAQIRLDAFDAKLRGRVDKLHAVVEPAVKGPPPPEPDIYLVEEKYAQLKIFWERQQEGDGPALEALDKALAAKPNMTIKEFFDIADGLAWSGLKDAKLQLRLPPPTDGKAEVEPLHAYDLILFEIAPEAPRLGRNYLFKHGLEYEWLLEVERKGQAKKQLTRRRTMEPRVVQYVPEEGKLYLSVRMRYGDQPPSGWIDLGSRDIQKSADFGWRSAFRSNELTALGIATVFAMISGMATYYFGKPAFGAIGDYIALFIWGAGVDQTKNFIQNLDKTSGKG